MLTLVLGGVSSGKSRFAVDLAAAGGGRVLFVATGRASDAEMEARIAAHRLERPSDWLVAEEPLRLEAAVRAHPGTNAILIDSIDGWVANRLEAVGGSEVDWSGDRLRRLEADCTATLQCLPPAAPLVICVSSEVGLSLVPLHPYGRAFADLLGRLNQRLAALATETYLVVAGVPIPLRSARRDRS
jgi:adenosylcobinamide kinase / adenosylcobinamide-phosphate guanylyltransferase